MPSIKSRKKTSQFKQELDQNPATERAPDSSNEDLKPRRPSNEGEFQTFSEVSKNQTVASEEPSLDRGEESEAATTPDIKIPGRDLVRKHFPKTYAMTEALAQNWVSGNFENIPIEQPLLRLVTKTSLKKAKEIETKIVESPITEKVFTKAFEIGLMAQKGWGEIKNYIKKTDKS